MEPNTSYLGTLLFRKDTERGWLRFQGRNVQQSANTHSNDVYVRGVIVLSLKKRKEEKKREEKRKHHENILIMR
jgi:hypothetical protein